MEDLSLHDVAPSSGRVALVNSVSPTKVSLGHTTDGGRRKSGTGLETPNSRHSLTSFTVTLRGDQMKHVLYSADGLAMIASLSPLDVETINVVCLCDLWREC